MSTVPVAPPLCNYVTLNDSSPGTQVWDLAAGAFVALNNATFLSWLSQLAAAPNGQPYYPYNLQIVSAASSDGGTTTTFTVDNTSIMTTGAVYQISGTGLYDGNFVLTVMPGGVTLKTSQAFISNATGQISGAAIIATASLLNNALRGSGLSLVPTLSGFYRKNIISISANTTLSNPLAVANVITATGGPWNVSLPPMNQPTSLPIGVPFTISNDSASNQKFVLFYNDGVTRVGGMPNVFPPGASVLLIVDDGSSVNGHVTVIGWFAENIAAPVDIGGTGVSAFAVRGTVYNPGPNNDSPLAATGVGTFGQEYRQVTGANPSWANGQTVGDNSTTWDTSSSSRNGVLLLTAALTTPRSKALPAANVCTPGIKLLFADVVGGITSTNTLTIPRSSTDTINGGTASVVLNEAYSWVAFTTDGVSAWEVTGGRGISSGPGRLASTDLSDIPFPVSSGGTGAATLTAHGILLGEGTSAIAATAIMTDGQLLVGQTGADPLPKTITGDVTFTAAGASALGNIPNDTTMAGDVLATNIAAPATPAAGKARFYIDSTSKNHASIDDAGNINHGVRTKAAVANNFLTAIADDGSSTLAQPSFSNISGTATVGQGGTGQTIGSYIGAQSWTPSDQSGAALTFSAVNVNYSRAGNMVFVYGTLTFPATIDASNVKIGGLPVTVANASFASNTPNVAFTNAGFAFSIVAFTLASTTNFVVLDDLNGAAITNVQMSGAKLQFNLIYPAT